ncbi:apolipoprotein L1 isoform X4 [Anguilla anguilla]|uniref:apolipoprotein L1 isoform X4 n=1 Tax=Anguilla anguilla TaxID=7936 RepID=UPI0015A8912F|nr:apolipoprotein L1 isoform X4 [Anguilla anguilla]
MEKKGRYLDLEEQEPEEHRKQEKGGKIAGMFRRSPKPTNRSLPEQDSLSTHSELSGSNDNLFDVNTKEKGGMFSGMFRNKSPKRSKELTPAQDNVSTHSKLSVSNDSLSDNNNSKEKGGMFSGMFKSPKRSKDPTAAQDNVSTHSELSASYDSLSDISYTKERGDDLTGVRRAPKPSQRTRPIQDSLSLHSDLSLSCEDLSESSSKSGIMGKILRNPFRAASQDRNKSEPEQDAGEGSPPTARRSGAKQNGVMNGILKNPFRSGTQEKEQDSDSEEKPTSTEHQPKHKQNAVVGAISKLNPFHSASKERHHKPEANLPIYENVVPTSQESDHNLEENLPLYEEVIPTSQERGEGGPSEGEVKKKREEAPRDRVPKKGKKPKNPFLPAKGAKGRTRREPRSEDASGDTSSDSKSKFTQGGTQDGEGKGKPPNWLDEYRAGGTEPEETGEEEEQDGDGLMEWWNNVEQWDDVTQDDEDLTEKEEAKAFALTADKVQKAIRVFNKLFTERAEGLWQHVIDLRTIADGIDRFNKKTKIAAITGGSTSALGGIATIAGLALAPVTMGTSLIVTAVGLGVATAGGLTSASASISNTVNNSLDRKKVEKIVEDYQSKMADISKCMNFIKQGIENLRKYDVVKMKNHAYNQDFPALTNIYEDGAMASKALLINTGEIMRVVQIANVAGSTAARAVQIASLATGVLTGLFVGMDIYFVAKDSRELKKGAKTEFAAKIREVAEQLHEGLVELNAIREEMQDASRNSFT